MKPTITLITALLVLLTTGCDRSNDTRVDVSIQSSSSSRIKVTRIEVMRDDIAYHGERGVYIITDTKTGKEYIGVSGIGISETGSHPNGKTRSSDER